MALLSGGWYALHPVTKGSVEVFRWVVKIAGGLLLCYIANPQYRVSMWLCVAPLRWLGLISYELYLVHAPIMIWAKESFGPCAGSLAKYIALAGGSFLASVVIAALFYKFFSLPILQAGRRKHVHATVPQTVSM